jgi:hypothetical protein
VRRLLGIVVVLVITGAALVAAEIAARLVDGYRLTSVRLEVSRDRQPRPLKSDQARRSGRRLRCLAYAQKLPV